jgi:hypothetical protein
MTMPDADGDSPVIPAPELTVPALRQAVAAVAPSRLAEFADDLKDPRRMPVPMLHRKWGVIVEIARHPETAHRLRAAERALAGPDPGVREEAVQVAGEIVRDAHRRVAGG